MQSLPGITHVYQVPCSSLLSELAYRAEAGIPIPIYRTPLAIPILGDATVELTESDDNNSQIEKVTLTFRTAQRIYTTRPSAFIVRTVEGKAYLIGSRARPYPTVKVTRTTGTPGGDAAAYEVQISLTLRKALLEVAIA